MSPMTPFLHTLRTILAAAAAKDELSTEQQAPALRFTLLAAAEHEAPVLPDEAWMDAGQWVSVQVAPAAGALRLNLQAEGFAAMEQVGRRQARLISTDGHIAVSFAFDASGGGEVRLQDTATIRRALADFSVYIGPLAHAG